MKNLRKKTISPSQGVSRRRFVGGLAATLAYLGLRPDVPAWAQAYVPAPEGGSDPASLNAYDALIKLSFNENPYGPSESVVKAMTQALKYANRYGYPDGGLLGEIARYHGVKPGNILLGAGSTEILGVAAETFLRQQKKVVGVEPTFGSVYEFATGLRASAIRLPLLPDYRQDIAATIKAARDNRQDVGLVYVCNPNNPTGVIVPKQEVTQLLDGLPEGIPVLIDEAYHHFADHPDYATSVPHVIEGRPVIVTRTFSKIAALAGMRLGYAVAPESLIDQMRPYTGRMTINALVKWGGVAALKDTAAAERVRNETIRLRKKMAAELSGIGYRVIPSDGNFFMVNLRRPVMPVIQAFRQRGILVGRPFPPMLEYLRVSLGTADDMDRFLAAFKTILLSGGR